MVDAGFLIRRRRGPVLHHRFSEAHAATNSHAAPDRQLESGRPPSTLADLLDIDGLYGSGPGNIRLLDDAH